MGRSISLDGERAPPKQRPYRRDWATSPHPAGQTVGILTSQDLVVATDSLCMNGQRLKVSLAKKQTNKKQIIKPRNMSIELCYQIKVIPVSKESVQISKESVQTKT
eukprot:SAG31_NODE_10_length_40133_cov_27.863041_30_plen_106_part_00